MHFFYLNWYMSDISYSFLSTEKGFSIKTFDNQNITSTIGISILLFPFTRHIFITLSDIVSVRRRKGPIKAIYKGIDEIKLCKPSDSKLGIYAGFTAYHKRVVFYSQYLN